MVDEQEAIEWIAAHQAEVLAPAFFGFGLDMLLLGVIVCQFAIWKSRLNEGESPGVRYLIVSSHLQAT